MVISDEDELNKYLGLRGQGRLGLISVELCELADSKVLRALFEVVSD